jgi:hypothetical protein
VFLKVQDRTTKIISSCPHFYDVHSYKKASQSSGAKPCTNVPIVCPECKPDPDGERKREAIWRYNLEDHFRTRHPDFVTPGWPAKPGVHDERAPSSGYKTIPSAVAEILDFNANEEDRLGVSVSRKWSSLESQVYAAVATINTNLVQCIPEPAIEARSVKRKRI